MLELLTQQFDMVSAELNFVPEKQVTAGMTYRYIAEQQVISFTHSRNVSVISLDSMSKVTKSAVYKILSTSMGQPYKVGCPSDKA